MAVRRLSSEIVSLIHHVELNESGWWKKAIGQVVKGVLWKASTSLCVNDIKKSAQQELSINLTDEVIQKQLETLMSQSAVIRIPGSAGPAYKLTEQTKQSLTTDYARATREREECEKAFIDACTIFCPNLDGQEVWKAFTRTIADAVRIAGANLFHLLVDGKLEKEFDWLATFFAAFDDDHKVGLRSVLESFFSAANQSCRAQVLRLLTAHFFAEAAQLRPETLALIENAKKKRTVRIVLDTNFIFSVLELHDNPANEAALTLLEMVEKNAESLEIKLYVLPGTLVEAQATLARHKEMVQHVRTTVAMANAALARPISGIVKRFFDAAKVSPGLTAEAFFQPYIDDLRIILMGKGIHVLDAHPSIYNTRQDIVDDVLDEQKREQDYPENRRKGYETLLHDVVLWHTVQDRRAIDPDTPLEVEYWAVSVDWRLISFDRKKRNEGAAKLPIVLHPSSLIQLVQFWIPRTKELEDSLFESLRLLPYFQQFDPEDERATVKVLEAISRFENISDLPESTLKVVLASKALRGRIREANANSDEILELVREELLSEHNLTVEKLGHFQTELAVKDQVVASTVSQLEKTAESLIQSQTQHREAVDRLAQREQELEDSRKLIADAESREAAVMAKNAEQAAATELAKKESEGRAVQHAQLKFTFMFLVLPVLFGILGGVIAYFVGAQFVSVDWPRWRLWAIVGLIAVIPITLAFVAAAIYVPKQHRIAAWWPAKLASRVGSKAVIAPSFLAIEAVFQGGIWDGLKKMVGID